MWKQLHQNLPLRPKTAHTHYIPNASLPEFDIVGKGRSPNGDGHRVEGVGGQLHGLPVCVHLGGPILVALDHVFRIACR